MLFSLETSKKMIYELKRELEVAKDKVVEDWQIRELVMKYEGEIFSLKELLNHNQ